MKDQRGVDQILTEWEEQDQRLAEARKLRVPKPKEVADELMAIAAEIEGYGDVPETDVRLQVMDNGSWSVHSGDASYDTDHRGYWGASTVDAKLSKRDAMEIAKDLIDQVEDQYAQSARRNR